MIMSILDLNFKKYKVNHWLFSEIYCIRYFN